MTLHTHRTQKWETLLFGYIWSLASLHQTNSVSELYVLVKSLNEKSAMEFKEYPTASLPKCM